MTDDPIEQQGLVDRLEAEFAVVRSEAMTRVVVVRAPPGWGKTFAVQRFYERLARDYQGGQPYWPETLAEHSGLTARKITHPENVEHRAEVTPRWLWWGVTCQLTDGGRSLQVLRAHEQQIQLHAEAIVRQLSERTGNQRDALELASSLLSLMPVPDVIGAAMGVSDLSRKLYRMTAERVQRRRRSLESVRQIRLGDVDHQSVAEWADALRRVLSPSLPLVLFLEDAHAMDPSTVELIVRLAQLSVPALIIATTWPDALLDASEPHATSTLLQRLSSEGRSASVHQFELQSLESEALGAIVRMAAPQTSGATIHRLITRCGGNPYVLHLMLNVQWIRQTRANDGFILDDVDLEELPSHVLELWSRIWWELNDGDRTALVLFALQGEESNELWTRRVTAELGIAPGSNALSDLVDNYGWLLALDELLRSFRERVMFDVATQNASDVLGPSLLKAARRSLIHQAEELLSDDVPQLSDRARLAVMRTYVAWADALEHVNIELAASCAQVLGQSADDRGAVADALRYIELALQWAPAPSPELRAFAARVQLRAGRPVDAEALIGSPIATSAVPSVDDLRRQLLWATAVHEQGRHDEAYSAASGILDSAPLAAGDDDAMSVRLEAMRLMGNSSFGLDERSRGRGHLEQAIAENLARERTDAALDVTLRRNLVPFANADGDREGARRLRTEILEARSRMLGDLHPDVLDARQSLANSVLLAGEVEEARSLLSELVRTRDLVFGDGNPTTLGARRSIACIDLHNDPSSAASALRALSIQMDAIPGVDRGASETFWSWTLIAEHYRTDLAGGVRELLTAEQVWGAQHASVTAARAELTRRAVGDALDGGSPVGCE